MTAGTLLAISPAGSITSTPAIRMAPGSSLTGRTSTRCRLAAQPKDLILEITEQQPDGRRLDRRLMLEKQ